jgi:hypothetical protein
MLKHVVFYKFKKGVDENTIAEVVEKGLAGLKAIIPEIMEFQLGRDVVRSERSYDFALVLEFQNLEAMRRHMIHPARQKEAAKLKEICDSVLLVDFKNQNVYSKISNCWFDILNALEIDLSPMQKEAVPR